MGTHGDSSLRLTRQEAAVIPGYWARENVAEARGELGPWCRFLGRSWGSRGGIAGQKKKRLVLVLPIIPGSLPVRGPLAMVVCKNRAKY